MAAKPSTPSAAPAATNPVQPAAPLPADGWLVVSSEEWVPVLNEAGRALAAMRDAHAHGDKHGAGVFAHEAASALRKEETERGKREKARLERAAKDLDELGDRFAKDSPVSDAEFHASFREATRAAATQSWLHIEEESVEPLFASPRFHFDRAAELLRNHDDHAAADEIRRGSGYFRLAANGARSDDRALLDAQVTTLAKTADEADHGTLTEAHLRSVLADVDAAYAASYLHQAEDDYRAKERAATAEALRLAAQRMRARAHWLEQKAHDAPNALIDEAESVASQLGRGVDVAKDKIMSLFKRAGEALQHDKTHHAEPSHG